MKQVFRILYQSFIKSNCCYSATRLHQSGYVEEQHIMERTGHRSTEAVRSYKRTSKEQLEEVSDILNNGSSQKRACPSNPLLEIDKNIVQNNSQCVSNSMSFEYTAQGTAPVFNIQCIIMSLYNHQ